jgi:Ankyrin repeat
MDIITKFELHDVEGIIDSFKNGEDPNQIFDGEPLIWSLVNMYTRSSRFKECVKAFVDFGLKNVDQVLLAVLLDDSIGLKKTLKKNPELKNNRYELKCTYAPLFQATLLHICAEYNSVNCAEILLENGFDINVKAGIDENGFGGHTPIFHTVNQNTNQSKEMFDLLMKHNADLEITIPGLIWGKGYDWETFVPSVNPISYAMMGLLPQFHRNVFDIYETVGLMMSKRYGINYSANNIPNKYLN